MWARYRDVLFIHVMFITSRTSNVLFIHVMFERVDVMQFKGIE